MKKNVVNCLIVLASVLGTTSAFAEKMDLNTHTVVIDRLRNIVKTLDESDVSKVPSTLRLADLLAERSRLKALNEVEQNCNNCLKAKEDRLEAIQHYQAVIPLLNDDNRGHAMSQKAHLHLSLNQVDQAEALQLQITKEGRKRHRGEILGQAHAALGDIFFQKADFKKAKIEFEKSLEIAETPQKGLVHYRLAWCLFNLDQVSKAITRLEMVLQTPKLTEYKGAEGVSQDESFKIDVSKDLSAFYARTTITPKTLERVVQLSPASHRMPNIHSLASEADRLGKKKEAALAWMFYLSNTDQKNDALEAQIRIMKLRRDMGDLNGALGLFAQIKETWNKQGCGDQCDELQAQIRQWIIHWNREEKKTQSTQLTLAYQTYSEIFPGDEEMLLLGATAAQQRKQLMKAYEFFRKAATVSHYNLNKSKNSPEELKKRIDVLNNALIGEMDMAETLKQSNLRMEAYQHYLTLNENGDRVFEVRFQIAKLLFEMKNYEKSSQDFRALAFDSRDKKHSKEKVEAAHLALDSLIQFKREDLIETWSLDFSNHFKPQKNEFYKIHRKSVLNNVASRINLKKGTSSDLTKLKSLSLVDSTLQEKKSLYKNMYLLALQLKTFKEALHANLNLLAMTELSRTERDQALQDRIWLAEMELDYKEAYKITKSLQGRMTADRALKLIWLAEMSQSNPDVHEKDFLKLSRNKNLRATVIARRIQRQMLPQKELKKHLSELSQSPEVLAKLGLEIYSKTKNKALLEDLFKITAVRKGAYAGLISRLLSYPKIQKDIAQLTSARLNPQSQNSLKRSLEARLKQLSHFETALKSVVKSQDLILQAQFLNVLKYEYARLHQDLLQLPLPKGLNPEQLNQYKSLLAQQAQPYLIKSEKVEEKLQALWKQSEWTELLAKNFKGARPEYRPALKEDLQSLIRHAPPSKAQQLQATLNEPYAYPSTQQVLQAQKSVRQSPFEEAPVLQLKDLEQKRGNDFTVTHLEARLSQMKGLFR